MMAGSLYIIVALVAMNVVLFVLGRRLATPSARPAKEVPKDAK